MLFDSLDTKTYQYSNFCQSSTSLSTMNSSYILNLNNSSSSKIDNLALMSITTITSITTVSILTLTALLIKSSKNQVPLLQNIFQNKIFQKYTKGVSIFLLDVFLFFFTAGWLLVASFPYGCFLFLRWSVVCYLKLRYGPLSSLVAGLDAIGTVDSPRSRQIIKSVKVLKGDCDLEDLRKRCEATVGRRDSVTGKLVYPKFYQYLDTCCGYYCWKPSTFDINHHVRFYDHCDIDLEKSTSESEAMKLISMNANEPFDEGRANWEILVIPKFHYDKEENMDEDKRVKKFAFIIRISHGIGDGFSLMKLIMRDMAGEKGECIPVSKSKETSWAYKIAVFLYVFYTSPRAFYKEMMLKDNNTLHNETTQLSGKKYIIWSEPINIEWLKATKNSIGSGMSTILLGALSGACRKYVLENTKATEEDLPREMSALIPMPAANHPDNTMCNKFSAIMFPLEFKTADPLERCKAIDVSGRHVASAPDAPVNLFLMNLIGVAPVKIAKYFIHNTQTTVVVSNVPGPGHAIKIWGYELLDTMFWLPTVGESGISVSFLSYKSHLRFGLTVDTGIVSDGLEGAQKLLKWMIEDLTEMANAVETPSEEVLVDIIKESEKIYVDRNEKPTIAVDSNENEIPKESDEEITEDNEADVTAAEVEDVVKAFEEVVRENSFDKQNEKSKFSFEDSILNSRHGVTQYAQEL